MKNVLNHEITVQAITQSVKEVFSQIEWNPCPLFNLFGLLAGVAQFTYWLWR